jgi:hypothetical protein
MDQPLQTLCLKFLVQLLFLNHRSITAALQGRTYKSQKTFPTKKIDAFKFLFLNYSN